MRDSPPFDPQAEAKTIVVQLLEHHKLPKETDDEVRVLLEDEQYINALEMVLEEI